MMKIRKEAAAVLIALLLLAASWPFRVQQTVELLPYMRVVNMANDCTLNYDLNWYVEDAEGARVFEHASERRAVDFLVNGCD
jgi:hypothetical protein